LPTAPFGSPSRGALGAPAGAAVRGGGDSRAAKPCCASGPCGAQERITLFAAYCIDYIAFSFGRSCLCNTVLYHSFAAYQAPIAVLLVVT
jgi:hypothetical protein